MAGRWGQRVTEIRYLGNDFLTGASARGTDGDLGRKDCRLPGQSPSIGGYCSSHSTHLGAFHATVRFLPGIAIGVILILFGSIVIFQALPAALDVLEMPSRIPFVREVYTWLMSSANGLTRPAGTELPGGVPDGAQADPAHHLHVGLRQAGQHGVLIIRAGVDPIRTAIEHSEDKVAKPTEQDRHF